MILEIDGILRGQRLRKMSGNARWHYAHYLLLANGYARIELDYNAIAEHFISFRDSNPRPEDVCKDFAEYQANHLIFVYSFGGRTWAQFDTKRSNTKHHKTAIDRRSPAPPEAEYQAWLKEQHPDDWGLYHWSSAPDPVDEKQVQSNQEVIKSSKNLESFTEISENLSRGVGVGVGVGKKKNHKARTARPEFKPPDFVTPAIWDGFVEMRDRIRKPMTPLAVELITKRLIQFKNRGHPPDEVLKQSIVNTWQNVFELKDYQRDGAQPKAAARGPDATAELDKQLGDRSR